MTLLVGELQEHLVKRQESSITTKLGDFTVNDDATLLTVTNGSSWQFPLDEAAAKALTRYLRVPQAYYARLDPDFQASVLRYHINRSKEAETTVESLNNEILAVHQPSEVMLPVSRVAEVVTKTLDPNDTIRRIFSDSALFHIDATTADHLVGFASVDQVGDITEAGFRIVTHPFRSKDPVVSTYLERLTCSNGMVTPETVGKISIKGRTVDEVIAEMEQAANLVLGQLDDRLSDYAATRTMPVPGSPQAFCAQLASEMNLPRKVLDAVLAIVNQLPAPVTVWDVNQAFTSVANQVERYATMNKLQTLGGSLALDAERMVDRCNTCERLI